MAIREKTIDQLANELLELNDSGQMSLPRVILIETRSKCNGTCQFCPASALTDERPDQLMPEEIFEKIINDLVKIDYSNRISLFNNNEPFLDKRIYDFVEYTRKRLPKAFIELKSNGTLLNEEKVLKIFNSGLDMLNINDYTTNKEHTKNVQTLKENLKSYRRFGLNNKEDKSYQRINIEIRDMTAVLGSRGGKSPNKDGFFNPYQNHSCMRSTEMMTINPLGNIGICCEDYASTLIVGNVLNKSIDQIWESEHYVKIRSNLLKGNRSINPICEKCDHAGYSQELLRENNVTKPSWANKLLLKRIIGRIDKVIKTKSLRSRY